VKTSREVAQLGGVARITVLKWAQRERVPKHGDSYAFDEASVRRFLGRNRQVGRPKEAPRTIAMKGRKTMKNGVR
jgi:hypothetical protein